MNDLEREDLERDCMGLVTLLRAHLSEDAWQTVSCTKPGQAVVALYAENEQLKKALQKLEWNAGGIPMCPECERYKCQGHAEHCIVGKALHSAPEGK